jgi:hypothetical protein
MSRLLYVDEMCFFLYLYVWHPIVCQWYEYTNQYQSQHSYLCYTIESVCLIEQQMSGTNILLYFTFF